MASKVMQMDFRGNIHIDIRVIEVNELNIEVKSDLLGRLEAAMAKITPLLLEMHPLVKTCCASDV